MADQTIEQGSKASIPRAFKASDIARAAHRCEEVAELNPKWPQARVRATVARELGVATVQLRYLLRRVGA